MAPIAPPSPLSSATFARGFTLTEMAVVLVIVALLIGGMLIPLSVQEDMRRVQDTQKILNDARDALLGFAAANGRLPCPATVASKGQESFASGGSAANGNCANFYDSFLPAAVLGLTPPDVNGLVADAWGQPIRYAVFGGSINGIGNPLTTTDGIKSATMPEVTKATVPLLSVCGSGTGITNADCGTALKLTDKAPAVIFSIAKNNATSGTDQAANLANKPRFVSHTPDDNFDDIVIWVSPNILFNRMIVAGRLP